MHPILKNGARGCENKTQQNISNRNLNYDSLQLTTNDIIEQF